MIMIHMNKSNDQGRHRLLGGMLSGFSGLGAADVPDTRVLLLLYSLLTCSIDSPHVTTSSLGSPLGKRVDASRQRCSET